MFIGSRISNSSLTAGRNSLPRSLNIRASSHISSPCSNRHRSINSSRSISRMLLMSSRAMVSLLVSSTVSRRRRERRQTIKSCLLSCRGFLRKNNQNPICLRSAADYAAALPVFKLTNEQKNSGGRITSFLHCPLAFNFIASKRTMRFKAALLQAPRRKQKVSRFSGSRGSRYSRGVRYL